MPFVYSIKCKLEPYKEYIGQTSYEDFQIRLNGHISEVNNGRRRHLYNAIRKHGWDKFQIEILHSFPREGNWQERLDELEIQEIAQRGTLSPGGYNNETGGNKNKVLHEETKELMSSVRSGEQHAMFGKHHNESTKDLLRDANRKEVQQWSKDGSEFIRTFQSIEEASGNDAKLAVNIGRVCSRKEGRKTAGGFHWKFVNQDDLQNKEVLKFTKLQQWSFDGTTLIEEFKTLREASDKTGTDRSCIGRCCKGRGRSAGGFKWKFV
jgi:group I intron endonuclease